MFTITHIPFSAIVSLARAIAKLLFRLSHVSFRATNRSLAECECGRETSET